MRSIKSWKTPVKGTSRPSSGNLLTKRSTRGGRGQSDPLTEKSGDAGVRLVMIESLLMRVVRQGDVSFRIEDVCLALLQDVLAEAYATRKLLWESLVLPQLRAEGIDVNELKRRFVVQQDQAKDYAYGEAGRIKQSQETAK